MPKVRKYIDRIVKATTPANVASIQGTPRKELIKIPKIASIVTNIIPKRIIFMLGKNNTLAKIAKNSM